jgi:hypothetical protein
MQFCECLRLMLSGRFLVVFSTYGGEAIDTHSTLFTFSLGLFCFFFLHPVQLVYDDCT